MRAFDSTVGLLPGFANPFIVPCDGEGENSRLLNNLLDGVGQHFVCGVVRGLARHDCLWGPGVGLAWWRARRVKYQIPFTMPIGVLCRGGFATLIVANALKPFDLLVNLLGAVGVINAGGHLDFLVPTLTLRSASVLSGRRIRCPPPVC